MENTIYNVYVRVKTRKMTQRLKMLCLENNLPIATNFDGFRFELSKTFYFENDKFVMWMTKPDNQQEVTESEFIQLLKNR